LKTTLTVPDSRRFSGDFDYPDLDATILPDAICGAEVLLLTSYT
jgi:hypothetical protein